MESARVFRINSPGVVHEPFEEEVVIVNLDTGRYYCLQKAGKTIWSEIAAGATRTDVVDALLAEYSASKDEIERAVDTLTAELLTESLIVPTSDAAARDTRAGGPSAVPKPPFEAPVLQTFTDMQDLLLLDPIHEVDNTGWPMAKKEPADPA